MMPDLFRARMISNVALLAEAGVLYLPSRVWATDFSYVMNTPASVWGDYNNDIDGADFGIWQANYPNNVGSTVATPEPATLGLLILVVLTLFRRQCKERN